MRGISFKRICIFPCRDEISQATDYDLVRQCGIRRTKWYQIRLSRKDSPDWLSSINGLFVFRFPLQVRASDCLFSALQHAPYDVLHPSTSLSDLSQMESTSFYIRQLLGARMLVFLMGVDIMVRHMSDVVRRPIEDLDIKPLAQKKVAGKPHGMEEILALLQPSKIAMPFPVKGFFGPETHRTMPHCRIIRRFCNLAWMC